MRTTVNSKRLIDIYHDKMLYQNNDVVKIGDEQEKFCLELMLKLPEIIPKLTAIEKDNGEWELVTGQEFCAIAKAILNNSLIFPLIEGYEHIKGLSFNDAPYPIQIRLKRIEVDVVVISRSETETNKSAFKHIAQSIQK